MNEVKAELMSSKATLMDRVIASDAARKGIAGAIAGVLVALVSEVIWPSDQ